MHKAFYSHYTPKQFNDSVGLLIGTGPYRMPDPTAWRPGTPIQLVRNERYWGPPPAFDRIYWREVEEDAASLTMYRNGEVDTFGASPEQYETIKDDPQITAKSNQFKYYFRDGGYTYVAWNQKRVGKPTLFTDKRVRQAMTMLIDRDRIVREIDKGYGKPAVGPFGVVSKQNDPAIQPWPYDVKRAKALLAEAGFAKTNSEGVLVDDSGREFRFKLTYNNKRPDTEKMVLLIKDSLARVGIVLEQEPSDWPIIIQKLTPARLRRDLARMDRRRRDGYLPDVPLVADRRRRRRLHVVRQPRSRQADRTGPVRRLTKGRAWNCGVRRTRSCTRISPTRSW